MQPFRVVISRNADYYKKSVDAFSSIVGSLKSLPALVWKYRDNPYGQCYHFVALDENDDVVGQLGNLPRPILVNGKTYDGVQSVDVVVAERCRKHGVFKLMSTLCKEDQSENKRLLAIYVASTDMSYRGVLKAKYYHAGKFDTYRRIVGPFSAIFEKLLGASARNNPVSRFLDKLLGLFTARKTGVDAAFVDRFETEFAMDENLAHWARNADYLNWRFADHPTQDFHCGVFTDGGKDIGFFAFRLNGEGSAAYIYDFYSSAKMKDCIVAVTNLITASFPGVNRVSYRCIGRKFVGQSFRESGYSRSDYDLNMFLGGLEAIGLNFDDANWYVSIGDSDW